MAKLAIICIDDQREVLSALRKDLVFFEPVCSIFECESADEAQELLDTWKDDELSLFLIICDHIMPGENGVDFFARLQNENRFPGMKKILLTGLANQQDTIRAINEAKINLYVEKPWDGDELLSSIKNLMNMYIEEKGFPEKDFEQYLD